MNRTLLVVMAAVALVALPALGAAQAPEMTAEQKAEMEAYTKAGTPGRPAQGDGRDGRDLRRSRSRAGTSRDKPPDGGHGHRDAHDGPRRPRHGRGLQGRR